MTLSLSRRALLAVATLVASLVLAAAGAASSAGSSGDLVLSKGAGAVSTKGASWH